MMESMSYVNIFETKGLEYLLVISFLIGFVLLVRRLSFSQTANAPEVTAESAARAAGLEKVCPAGADCPYQKNHEFAREEERAVVA